ncbi:MAG: hypothetical protein R3A10_08805 [Caldilineaceae bacterium]
MLLAGQLPHPMLEFPVVPGYETVGRVVEVGADVASEWLGRWVFLGGAHCFEKVNPAWGGQSAMLFAKVDRVVPLDDIEPVHGVLLSLAATALHGVDRLNVTAGQRILVLGQGPVGQIAARLAAQRGAWVAVTDQRPAGWLGPRPTWSSTPTRRTWSSCWTVRWTASSRRRGPWTH